MDQVKFVEDSLWKTSNFFSYKAATKRKELELKIFELRRFSNFILEDRKSSFKYILHLHEVFALPHNFLLLSLTSPTLYYG